MTRVSEDTVPCLHGPLVVCTTSSHAVCHTPGLPLPLPCRLSPPPLAWVRPSASVLTLPGPQAQSSYSGSRAPRRIPQGAVPINPICSVSHCGQLTCTGPRA